MTENKNETYGSERYPQPFQVKDEVKITSKYHFAKPDLEKMFRNKKLRMTSIKWIGFGNEDNPYGCQSGWVCNAAYVDDNGLFRMLYSYDSDWFVKWEEE